jgi:ubiquitin carboxyl-terminal hydrolase 10
MAAALQDITLTATTVSRPLEGSERQDSDIDPPSAERGTGQKLSTPLTHAPAPALSSHFPPPYIHYPISASRPTVSATLPRLRARGLVNTGNICFANAVLQLLVNSPPLWNLFRELGDLTEQRGAGVPETGGGPTPLVDSTVRLFKEFIVEESPSTQQQSQPATGGMSRADEEKRGDNVVGSFEPMYVYNAMKEKRQLKPLFVRPRTFVTVPYY